jgi:uncharacterized protein YkwD
MTCTQFNAGVFIIVGALIFLPSIHATTLLPKADRIAHQVLEYTNQFRAKKRLNPCQWNQKMASVALEHSEAMGNHRVPFDHNGFKQRVARFPFPIQAASENLFMCNFKDTIAQRAVHEWIQSPGHLQNLVGNYTHCGVGVYKNSKGYWYVTQLFALAS